LRAQPGQVSDARDSGVAQQLLGLGPDPPETSDRKRFEEGPLLTRFDHHEPVGLAEVRGDLGHELVTRDPDRGGQADLAPDAPLAPFRIRPDHDRLAAQLGAVADLDRGIERVHVDVQDRAHHREPPAPSRSEGAGTSYRDCMAQASAAQTAPRCSLDSLDLSVYANLV